MKRVLGVGATVLGAMTLAGCGAQPERSAGPQDMPAEMREQVREQSAQSPRTEWLSALAAGKTLECEYRMAGGDGMDGEAGGEGTVRMIMDQNRYRTEVRTEAGGFVSIFDGEASYSWTVGERQGMKMRMDCMEDFGQAEEVATEEAATDAAPGEETYRSPEEALDLIPDISCREISSADFSVPEDVEFVDQCEMLREQTRAMEQYRDAMPEDVAKMMEEMGR